MLKLRWRKHANTLIEASSWLRVDSSEVGNRSKVVFQRFRHGLLPGRNCLPGGNLRNQVKKPGDGTCFGPPGHWNLTTGRQFFFLGGFAICSSPLAFPWGWLQMLLQPARLNQLRHDFKLARTIWLAMGCTMLHSCAQSLVSDFHTPMLRAPSAFQRVFSLWLLS